MPFSKGSITSWCSRIPQRWIMYVLFTTAGGFKLFGDKMVGQLLPSENSLAMRNILEELIQANNVAEDVCTFRYYEEGNDTNVDDDEFYGLDYKDIRRSAHVYTVSYLAFQIPASALAYRFGSCKVIGVGMLGSSFMLLLYPIIAKEGGNYLFLFATFVEAVFKSPVFPCLMNIAASWCPASRRNTFIGVIGAGLYFGSVTSRFLFMYVIRNLKDHQTTTGFYIVGVSTMLWSLTWLLLAYDSPLENPNISDEEITYLHGAGAHLTPLKGSYAVWLSIPWKSIFTSIPFLCLCLVYFADEWFDHSNIENKVIVPYAEHILHLSYRTADQLNLVTFAAVPGSIIGGVFNDWLVNRKIISKTVANKIVMYLGIVFSSILMMCTTLTKCNVYTFTALFTGILFLKGLSESWLHCNNIDLSPRYAGLILAIANFCGKVSSMFCGAMIAGVFTTEEDEHSAHLMMDKSNWLIVFGVHLGLTHVLTMFYMFRGSTKEQPWNNPRFSSSPRVTGIILPEPDS